jgi:hypothetical protein
VTEVQLAAAGMLGRGKTYGAVARTVGVSERTLYNWAKVPGFTEEVERVRALSSKPEPRAEVAALLRELGADADVFLAPIPDGTGSPREQERLPGGMRFFIEQHHRSIAKGLPRQPTSPRR